MKGLPTLGALRQRFGTWIVVALVATAGGAVLSSCGGGEENGAGGPTGEPTAAAAETQATQDVALDLEAIGEFERYRFTGSFRERTDSSDTSVDMELVVAGDDALVKVTAVHDGATEEEGAVRKAGEFWVLTNGNWEADPEGTGGAALLALAEGGPGLLFSFLGTDSLTDVTPTMETVEGVETLHVRMPLSPEQVAALGELGATLFGQPDTTPEELVSSFVLDIWVAEDGSYPAMAEISGGGETSAGGQYAFDASAELTHVNDPSLEVETP